MNYEEAREELKGRLPDYVRSVTKPSKGRNMYECPLCPSGTGHSKTGAFSITPDGKSWKCFSCGEHGDIFDLIGKVEGISEPLEQLKRASDIYGVSLEYQKQDKNEQYTPTHSNIHTDVDSKEAPADTDFTAFFLQANRDLGKTDYHRGISKETLDRFKVGYVENWKHPNAPSNAPASPRLIIPISRYSYLARDTRPNLTAEQAQYKKQKAKGTERALWIFNSKALSNTEKPIFIVEGELDALSIIDAGGEAVALGSIAYIDQLFTILDHQKPTQPLIICLDNEQTESVEKAKKKLEDGLTKRNIDYYEADITGSHKDANEALQADREAFTQALRTAETQREAEEQAKKDAYLQTSTASFLQAFVNGIAESVNTPFIPTGFKKLDGILEGGLNEGLYVVGAISSLGKTTLVTQIADQIAQGGQDVLIFSLEMARYEIMAKSISRHTLQNILTTGGDMRNAKTCRGITTGKRYAGYSQTEKTLIAQSIAEYGKYADHLYIVEGVGDITVKQIKEAVKEHIHFTGNTPVVVIDYAQVISPEDPRQTDKQAMDRNILELKRLSRDYKTPVIAISSLNRANYSTPITMEALKETGGLEYTSDVVIGLQFKGTGGKNFDVNDAKKKTPREIELVILKNRNGRTGDTLEYQYYPAFNYFKEI